MKDDPNQPQNSKATSAESIPAIGHELDEFPTLMAQIRQGNPESLQELVQSCRDYLLLIANQELDGNLNQKVGPSDIVQNTMLAIHQHVDEFRGERREQFMAWIRQILLHDVSRARREFKGAAKRNSNRETSISGDSRIGKLPIDLRDSSFTPQTAAVRNEEERLLQTALLQLSENERQIIVMRNQEQLPFSEIGNRLDCSDDAAQKKWTRAIEKLKLILKAMNALE